MTAMTDWPPMRAMVSSPSGWFGVKTMDLDLDAYRAQIGCATVQALTVPNAQVRLFFDEDGKPRGRAVNRLATAYLDVLMPGFAMRDCLVGDVVWTGVTTTRETVLPITVVEGMLEVIRAHPVDGKPMVLVQTPGNLWYFGTAGNRMVSKVLELVEQGVEVSVLPWVSAAGWQEIQVELVDDVHTTVLDGHG